MIDLAAFSQQLSEILSRHLRKTLSLEDLQHLLVESYTSHPARASIITNLKKAYLAGSLNDHEDYFAMAQALDLILDEEIRAAIGDAKPGQYTSSGNVQAVVTAVGFLRLLAGVEAMAHRPHRPPQATTGT